MCWGKTTGWTRKQSPFDRKVMWWAFRAREMCDWLYCRLLCDVMTSFVMLSKNTQNTSSGLKKTNAEKIDKAKKVMPEAGKTVSTRPGRPFTLNKQFSKKKMWTNSKKKNYFGRSELIQKTEFYFFTPKCSQKHFHLIIKQNKTKNKNKLGAELLALEIQLQLLTDIKS